METNTSYIKHILFIWLLILAVLIIHTKGIYKFKFLEFNEASGHLQPLEMNYKEYNILGLKNIVYAVPFGPPFYHPNRTDKLDESKTIRTYSINHAKYLIDNKIKKLNHFNIIDYYKGFNLFVNESSSKYFATLDYNSINPNFIYFKEYFHSSNIQELKKKIDKSF